MAKEENKQKRVIVGAIIFAILILANIVIHTRRANRKATPSKVNARSPISKPNTLSKIVRKVPSKIPNTNSYTQSTNSPLNVEAPKIQKEYEVIEKKIASLRTTLMNTPEPGLSPKMPSALMTSRQNLFQFDFEIEELPKVAIEPRKRAVASATISYDIIGTFSIKGKKKLWVRKGEKVFIVNEDNASEEDEVTLLSYVGDDYKILDDAGKRRTVTFENTDQQKINEVVALLRARNQQISYDFLPGKEDGDKKNTTKK